jgi:hypothetical protein
MSFYKSDRKFTDFVHQHLALPLIYAPLGWQPYVIDADTATHLDIHEGIDYTFLHPSGKKIQVQERFRDAAYIKYNDCTLRYRRDDHADSSRHASEFFKIKADFLVYGITNGSKEVGKRSTLTGFSKFVVVNLHGLYAQIEAGNIIFKPNIRTSYIYDGKMIAPIQGNNDASSSFVAFDVGQLHLLFEKERVVWWQYGFLVIA